MSFFDIFNTRPYPKIEAFEPMETDNEPSYQVGKTADGRTTLRVGYSTVTMNSAGLAQLIRMLESALELPNDEPEDEDYDGHPN
jgi:hypothetical protein